MMMMMMTKTKGSFRTLRAPKQIRLRNKAPTFCLFFLSQRRVHLSRNNFSLRYRKPRLSLERGTLHEIGRFNENGFLRRAGVGWGRKGDGRDRGLGVGVGVRTLSTATFVEAIAKGEERARGVVGHTALAHRMQLAGEETVAVKARSSNDMSVTSATCTRNYPFLPR